MKTRQRLITKRINLNCIRMSGWVSEWMLFNVKWAILQLYHGKKRLHFTFWWYDDMSLHSDTLSCFHANQSLFLPVNVVYLAEKQQIPIQFDPIVARIHDLPYSRLTLHDRYGYNTSYVMGRTERNKQQSILYFYKIINIT